MKLTFLGTRGKIEARSDRHGRHTSLLVAFRGKRVMVDAGEDWLGHVEEVDPDAIIVTHAHPDHVWGLKNGAPCPVWAPEIVWRDIEDYPVESRHTVAHRQPIDILGITFEAFPVAHSTVAPAVGYRITAGKRTVFYVPDVVHIEDREDALRDVRMYIGDAATITQSMVRLHGKSLVGHAPVRTQLTWCEKEGVRKAFFTHCGPEIVTGDEKILAEKVAGLGRERNVEAIIAHDGLEITVE